MSTSPSKTKDKLSLRKRLFIKKSTKVGCYIDSGSLSDDGLVTSSRPISPANPFIVQNNNVESTLTRDTERNASSDIELYKSTHETVTTKATVINNTTEKVTSSKQATFFKRCRPQSLIEEQKQKLDLNNSLSEKTLQNLGNSLNSVAQTNSVQSRPLDIPIGKRTLRDNEETLRKFSSFDNHSGSFDKPRSKALLKRLSADNLVQCDKELRILNHGSPDSERSGSLDRKNKFKGSTITRSGSRAGSTDSLARNSLLAAQVLRLIPTQEARERNFLHGRLASNSLLGAAELEHVFPDREVTVFAGTWNMNGQSPPRELNDFIFPTGIKHVPDIFVLGTQESFSERTEWEISVQEVLGPSHILLHSTTLGTLHLTVFIRRDLIWFCSLPEDANLSVRPGTAFRTKGAVAISFALFGSSFLFVTAHLTAHQEKVKERVQDIKRIIRALDLPKNLPCKHKSKDVTNNFDYVIWCGDLNFRLAEPRAAVLRWIEQTKFPLPPHLPHGLLHADQLTAVLADGAAFRDFREAPITFPPTYKYDPGSQQFDTSSKQRVPAYTDRILYKTKNSPVSLPSSALSGFRRSSNVPPVQERASGMRCVAYDSVNSICTSDHKPVWALFTASLRPGTDVVPLAAGLFNREVYLEGIKRRAAILDHEPGTSAICSVQ